MSKTDSAPDTAGEWDDIQEWAAASVMGANNWLVTIRNAEDEGYDPWSDRFTASEVQQASETGQETGVMSYSEGLTALAMTDEFARDRSDWLRLQPELYRADLKSLLEYIHPDEGEPNYTPEPYLSGDLTGDFTDAVSFSTSALMGALKSDISLTDEELEMEDIKAALETNIEWFLDNEIKMEGDALGWAWVGSECPNNPDPTPQNYFTYSAIYPLCELLNESDNPEIQDVVDGYEDRIRRHLKGAKEFLVNEHWQRDRWGGPIGSNETLSTCYTIISLSLMSYMVEDIELSDETHDKISAGVEFLVDKSKRNPESIWQLRARYNCGGAEYFDGSGPYLFLDTIAEFLNYDIGNISDMEHTEGEIEAERDDFTEKVLDKCWAGTAGFQQKGFRHLGNPERPKDDPKSNPTVIYTTQVGIETFLLNILDEGDSLPKPSRETGDDSTPPATEQDVDSTETASAGASQRIQNQYNLSFVFAGDEAQSREAGDDQLHHRIERELEQLFGDGEAADGIPPEVLTTTKDFTQTAIEARSTMQERYQEVYGDIKGRLGSDVLKDAKALADEELEHELLEVNVEEFLRMLTGSYFAMDPETFRDELDYYREQHWIFVLEPQRDAWETLDEMVVAGEDGPRWHESFGEFEQRADAISRIVDAFADDVLNGAEPTSVGNEFDQRDFAR